MGSVCDETRALVIEHQAGWLTAGAECYVHLSLGNLVNISIGRDRVEVSLLILGGAVERNRKLEYFFVVGLRNLRHCNLNLSN